MKSLATTQNILIFIKKQLTLGEEKVGRELDFTLSAWYVMCLWNFQRLMHISNAFYWE